MQKQQNEALERVIALEAQIPVIQAQIVSLKTAFIKNDIGGEDYDGHRRDHLVRKQHEDALQSIKLETAKKVVWSLIVGACAFAALLFKSFFGL
jgi:hypothetical protein